MKKFLRILICLSSLASVHNICLAKEYMILSGNASQNLTKSVAEKLHVDVDVAKIGRFNDGEISIKIEKSVRDKDVYIIQSIAKSPNGSINDNLMELYLLIRTLKRSNAGKITAIIPYYGYARQDRKNESRVPISASDVAILLENSGVDRVVALDLHAGQIQGFFHNVPVDDIYGSIFMAPKVAELKLNNPVIISPDAGGVARAKKFRDTLAMYGIHAELAIIIKQRARAGVIESANLIGDVKGKDAIIVDDICDTGGTLVKAAEELKKFGANKVYASITHPVFSKDAINKIENSVFEQVYVSDSIAIEPGKYKKITQVSVANLLAMVVQHLDHGESLSDLFMPKKSYIEEYGESKIYPLNVIYPNMVTGNKLLNLESTKPINVAVASNNEIQLKAAKAIFTDKFKVNSNVVKITGFSAKSGISDQPIGLEKAIKGAQNRINDLKSRYKSKNKVARYIISIENFFTELHDNRNPTDHALVVIEDPNGNQYRYVSVGVEINESLYKTAMQQDNVTVGSILAEKYGVSINDWHEYVTGSKINRYEQILSAL
jgi:ribose-phosphate pyrophosphokinase